MNEKFKILIVEDEMLIGANISLQLHNLGYEVTAILPRGEDALKHIEDNPPDIMLLDINLKGSLDGIETALKMQKSHNIPIIYLTANTDDAHFNRAKETKPYGFISKPFKKLDLQRTIELAIEQINLKDNPHTDIIPQNTPYILNNCLFVRHLNSMVKVLIQDILYIEADRNYCRITCKDKEYLVVTSLKDMDEKLPNKHFLRTHRSFIINLSQIKEIATSHVIVDSKVIPITKSIREELLKRIQAI